MVQDEVLKLKFDNSCGGKLFATQNDTGRIFTVQILSDKNNVVDVTGMSLRLYIGNQKEVAYCDGEIIDAEKGKFKLQLFNSQLKYPGIQQAQFILKKDDRKIGSKIFDIHIEEGVEAGSSMGVNLVIMYDEIKEAAEFLKGYDKTLEEAKKVDSSLKVGIKEGKDIREDIANHKEEAIEIKNDLENTTKKVQDILNEAVSFKDDVESIKNTLVEENTKANSNLTNLTSKIAETEETATKLENKISTAKTIRSELEETGSLAENIKQSLEVATTDANTIKLELGSLKNQGDALSKDLTKKIDDGKNLKSSFDASMDNANSAKTILDESVKNAADTNATLIETDDKAKNTETLIKNLMNQLGKTKEEVQGIIASGNLDQYVTDPKLQETLKNYATKADLQGIDVTSQLADYAKKTDLNNKVDKVSGKALSSNDYTNTDKAKVDAIPDNPKYTDTTYDLSGYAKKTEIKSSLSEMTSDSTHRTVTDNEKSTWNNKVDKIAGKGLSANDFTNELKAELDKITMKDTPSTDFNSVSKEGIYNGSFSTNCPNGSGKYTLFVYPTDSSSQHRENYMFQIAVKDNVDSTPYFRQRRGSSSWGKWYKYSTNDYTDSDKAKITNIPASPKYTDTVTTINGKTGAITKADIVALGIPGQDTNTTYGLASQSSNGLMSAADKKRLDNIKEQVSLTEAQYNALSSSQQNDSKKIYFIKA